MSKWKETVEKNGGTILSDYVNSYTKIRVKCDKDHIWEALPRTLETYKCFYCQGSNFPKKQKKPRKHRKKPPTKGEIECSSALKELNIDYVSEYVDSNLPYRRYDFMFIHNEVRYLLEFDGEQHFHRVNKFHRSNRSYNESITRDLEKTDFALTHDFTLIRIDYTQIDNIRSHLRSALSCQNRLYLSNEEMYTWLCSNRN